MTKSTVMEHIHTINTIKTVDKQQFPSALPAGKKMMILFVFTALFLFAFGNSTSPLFKYSSYVIILPFKYVVYDVIRPAVVELLSKNQFAQVFVFGGVTAYLAYLLNLFYRFAVLPIFLELKSSIVIHNTDPNFYAVIDFIADNLMQHSHGSQYSLQVNTKTSKMTHKDYVQEWLGTQSKNLTDLVYRPDNDQVIHKLHYKGRLIFMERSKSANPLMSHDTPFTPESLKLTVWGKDNTILKQLFAEAIASSIKNRNLGNINIYTLSSSCWLRGWELARTKKIRPKESVILDMDDMDVLINDGKKFLHSGKWYVDMGIPYRRGYLLYGPPGCGKTSFVQVLAGELHLDLCILNLNHNGLNDSSLCEYLNDAPANSIIVLEDVDAIFVERTSANKDQSSVSFSGLLNALDGVASQEGRLLFMTTNHIEKLDPALIRPGRCDVQLQLRLASKNQIERMFLRFFPEDKDLAKHFASRLPAHELSMASLQGYFLKNRISAAQCIENLSDLLKVSTAEDITPRRSIYEHLYRVGLERYAALFEFRGIYFVDQLHGIKLDEIVKSSYELQYDQVGKDFLKLLLEGSDKERIKFEKDSYALAEVSQIRDHFMSAYAQIFTTQQENGDVDAYDKSRALSKQLCEILSANGKGIISLFNLRRLVDSHPNRPLQCLAAAKAFISPRSEESKIVHTLSLYQFLKRAGLKDSIHCFSKRGISTVRDLMEEANKENRKVSDIVPSWQKKFKLSTEQAFTLAEIVTSTSSDTGHMLNFCLYDRSRYMGTFSLFYSISSHLQDHKVPNEDQSIKEKIAKEELEELAYQFSVLVTDPQGYGVVSMMEVMNYLTKYPSNPADAINNVVNELVNPPYPKEVIEDPPDPEPKTWIDEWLSTEHPELVNYVDSFKEQGFKTKEDVLMTGSVFDMNELQSQLHVDKLAHRKKIVTMHEALIKQESATRTP